MSFSEACMEAAAEFHAHEMNVDGDASERAWMRWINAAEKRVGHDIDHDGPQSLDAAYDAWLCGTTVVHYCHVVWGA